MIFTRLVGSVLLIVFIVAIFHKGLNSNTSFFEPVRAVVIEIDRSGDVTIASFMTSGGDRVSLNVPEKIAATLNVRDVGMLRHRKAVLKSFELIK